MISATWPMPEKQVDPQSRIIVKKQSFDPTPFLDLYNKLDTLPSPKAGNPTVKGAVYVSKNQLPDEIFFHESLKKSNVEIAAMFGIPCDYLSSVNITIEPQFSSDMPLFTDCTVVYRVEIERYLSNDEPF